MTALGTIPDRWRRLDVTVRDLPLGLFLAATSFLPILYNKGTQVGDLPARPFDALAAVALALECLPLAVRRKMPAVCLTLVTLGFVIAELRSTHLVASSAMPIALLSAGAHLERCRRTAVVALTAVYAGLAYALHLLGSTEGVAGFTTFYLLLAVAWTAGAWLRGNRAAEVDRRRHVAETTRAAERARIARELHDVVTHHVTAMVVQAEAARYLQGAPERLDAALAAVGDTGRRATADLRHLLGLLEPGHGSEAREPTVGRLLTLVEQTRHAGQPVAFAEEGTPVEATGSADLVAYRVVQESLTNALKHAVGAATSVLVRHRDEEITVEVRTAGPGSGRAVTEGGGRGLAGLRERVDVLGGDFSAGPGDEGFTVRARIPSGGRS
ncbi:sensor histidine kinase [Glycomyces paridis]|uniref:histidine kinase n=1 Tax=Glycomyces paridis TaxID=2126555 RepID=A0A4S8NX85_9ACTN|nr:histidine kinase [Glycomyces paridis]THV22078.1 two-component sensor histidine kinase [Glycomyces paridis]